MLKLPTFASAEHLVQKKKGFPSLQSNDHSDFKSCFINPQMQGKVLLFDVFNALSAFKLNFCNQWTINFFQVSLNGTQFTDSSVGSEFTGVSQVCGATVWGCYMIEKLFTNGRNY